MNKIKQGNNQFFIGENEEQPLAKITFIPKEDTLVVNHTFVSEQLRGQGIAKKLVEEVLQYAEKENKKIVPECSYVDVFKRRYPEHRDLFV